MSNIFETPMNSLGRTGNAGSKTKIEPDIYEAVIIAVADAGKAEKTWQGQTKTVNQIILAIQIDHVNGFGDQSMVTEWMTVSGHENSNFTKNFLVPCKLSVNSIGELVGKNIRVEIEDNAEGYAHIARYFASKKPHTAVATYLPKWLVEKGFPMRTMDVVIPGVRVIAPKASGDELIPTQTGFAPSTPTAVPGFNAAAAGVDADASLPF